MGLILMVVVHSAAIQHRDGAKLVLEKAKGKFPRMELILNVDRCHSYCLTKLFISMLEK